MSQTGRILRERIPIDDDEHLVEMGADVPVLMVGRSPAHPTNAALDIWFADHDGLERTVRIFRVYGTGHPIELLNWDHRGSYTDLELGLVWHLLELVR